MILSSALARLVEFVAELALVMILLGFFHHEGVPASYLLVLPLVVVLFVLVVGISLPVLCCPVAAIST